MAQMLYKIPYFSGIDQSGLAISSKYTPDAYNIDTSLGTLKKAAGYAKHVPDTVPGGIRTIIKYHKRNEGDYEDYLLASSDTAVYAYIGGEWTSIKSGLGGGCISFINYQQDGEDVVIMTNGQDTPFKYDGTTVTNMADVPCFSNITLHYERMWGAGDGENPDRVYYSAAFDPDDFSTSGEAGFIDIPTFDGGSVIAITAVFNDIVVFKEQNVYRIYGTYPGVYEVTKVHGVKGPIAKNSIVSTGDVVFFLASDGICYYDGVCVKLFKKEKIQDVLGRINKSYAAGACACFHDEKTIRRRTAGYRHGEQRGVIEYDTIRDAFMLRTGFCVESFLKMGEKLLFCNSNGYVYGYGEGEDYDGGNINAYWETPFTDLGQKNAKKYLKTFYAFGKGESIKVSAEAGGNVKEKSISLSGETTGIKERLTGKGRRFRLMFQNVDGSDFEIVAPEMLVETDED